MDYLSITGLRTDGRFPSEHRRINMELGVHRTGDGSAMFELGNSKVWATCRGPRESNTTFGVTVEIVFAAFSMVERKKQLRNEKRSRELAQLIEKSLSRIVETRNFPRSRVDLQVRVIQSDGGLPWACFNACSLALMDAGVPMIDLCVACGVGFIDRVLLIDPNHSESVGFGGASLGGELWMVLAPREARVVSTYFTGKVSQATFEEMLGMAEEACQQIFRVLTVNVLANYKTQNQETELEDDFEDQ